MRRRKLNRRQRSWLTEALGKVATGVFVAMFVVAKESVMVKLVGMMTVGTVTMLALWLERDSMRRG